MRPRRWWMSRSSFTEIPFMRGIALIAAAMLAIVPASAQRTEILHGTSPFPWPRSMSDLQNKNFRPSVAAVQTFINGLKGAEQRLELGIGEYRFASLQAGRIQLIATVDSSGRGLFFGLMILSPQP